MKKRRTRAEVRRDLVRLAVKESKCADRDYERREFIQAMVCDARAAAYFAAADMVRKARRRDDW